MSFTMERSTDLCLLSDSVGQPFARLCRRLRDRQTHGVLLASRLESKRIRKMREQPRAACHCAETSRKGSEDGAVLGRPRQWGWVGTPEEAEREGWVLQTWRSECHWELSRPAQQLGVCPCPFAQTSSESWTGSVNHVALRPLLSDHCPSCQGLFEI